MAGIKDQDNIEELKQRLYDRGVSGVEVERHRLTREPVEVSRGWGEVSTTHLNSAETASVEPLVSVRPEEVSDVPMSPPELVVEPLTEANIATTSASAPRRRYRRIVVLATLIFFIITVSVSSVYLFFGANQISAKNINVVLNTPVAVAGGEAMTLQVGITNQNSVPVRSAILVVNYPSGTRAADETGRELYEERLPVDDLAPGEVRNISLRAVLYGEENEEKEISASFQYRVEGSNGLFEKDAEPQKITISSSPLLVRVSGVEKVSSGQELELRLLVQSNATTPQRNLLVTLSYPNSFSFLRAEPEPAYGKNSWLIDELPARGTTEIVLRGVVEGLESESAAIQVQVGNPQLSNQFLMGSILAQTRFDYAIEKPFTGVTIAVNGDTDGVAVLSPGTTADVVVTVENTLDQPIYDLRVDLKPTGNLIRDDLLVVREGFYDASEQTIRFDASGNSRLAEVGPGETRSFSFEVKPDDRQQTASFAVSVSLYARRVDEQNAAESLIGSDLAEVKYSSTPEIGSQLEHGTGPFTDTGAIPPVAGRTTQYTATLVATAGVNDLTGVVVTAKLPQYVSWLDEYEGEGTVEFNTINKEIRWSAGDINAGRSEELTFQVGLLPSVTQVGRTAVVIGMQELRATDRFTGVALRATRSELSNELSTELGFTSGNGIIQATED